MTGKKNQNKLKIFEIRHGDGDLDWVSAYTNIHALKIYIDLTDIDFEDFMNKAEIVELPKNKWKLIMVNNKEGDAETFSEYMKKNYSATIITTNSH